MGNIKLIPLLFFTAAVLVMPSYAGTAVPKPTPSDKPVYTAYRGIEIGMAAADVHKKLVHPRTPRTGTRIMFSLTTSRHRSF